MSKSHSKELVDAIVSRDTNALRSAISNGADPDARLQASHPLVLATMAGSRPNVELLLEHGANPNAKDHTGRTALHYAALGSPDADAGLVATLVNAGADVNSKDLRDATPLDLASGAGNKDTTLELVRLGATCRQDRLDWVRRVASNSHAVGPRGGP